LELQNSTFIVKSISNTSNKFADADLSARERGDCLVVKRSGATRV